MRIINLIFKRASKVNPLFYLLIYLFMVPVFGVIYLYAVPHDFYAPYAEHEPAAITDRSSLRNVIVAAIESIVENNPQNTRSGDWTLSDPSATDFSYNTDDGSATFRLDFREDSAPKEPREPRLGNVFSIEVYLPFSKFQMTNTPGKINALPEFDLDKATGPSPNALQAGKEIIQKLFQPRSSGDRDPILPVDEAFITVGRSFQSGLKGDPSELSGAKGRMLYLSAVVLTTLGLGDIVPMTAAARFFVALEAITGVTLAGLFLNALSYQASRKDDA